eukprot:6054759-Karenia_brevis.AAC.1
MDEQPSTLSTPSEVETFNLDFDIDDEPLENSEHPAEDRMQNDIPDAQVRGDPHESVKKETSQSSSSKQYSNDRISKPKHSWDQPESSESE